MKRVTKDIIIFCVVFLAAVIFLSQSFTGNTVWNDIKLDNCSDTKINQLWDDVFVKSSAEGISITKNNTADGYCNEFLAYNYSNGDFYIIYSVIWNNTWNDTELYTGSNRILEQFATSAFYYNTTNELFDWFESLDFDEKIVALNSSINPENLTDWNLSTENILEGNLSLVYESNILSDVTWNNNSEYWDFLNTSVDDDVGASYDYYIVSKSESVSVISHSITYFDPSFYVKINGSIPDFSFEPNVSWQYAFSLDEYINFSDDNTVILNFSADNNNSNGEYINGTIDTDSNVSFIAAENFTGTREFIIKIISPSGSNTSSNSFNVTFNTEPEQLEDIENFIIENGTTKTIDLDEYFYDGDGHTLNYSVYGSFDGIDVGITNSELEIGLGTDFDGLESLRISVSDGLYSILSNRFNIYEDSSSNSSDDGITAVPEDSNDSQALVEEGEDDGDEGESVEDEESNSPEAEISSNNINQINEATDSKKVLRIVLWSFLSVIFLAIIAIIVMMFLKSKKNGYSGQKNQSTVTQKPTTQQNNKPPLRQVMQNRGPGPNRGRPPVNPRR